MPLASKKKYARFNVGKYMVERKQTRDCLAASHESLEDKKRLFEATQQKLKRLETKVRLTEDKCFRPHI